MALYGLPGETSRSRRARRLARTWKRRCPLCFFSLSLLSLVYLAFFGARLPFDSLHHGRVNERTFANEIEKSRMMYAHHHMAEDIDTLNEGQSSYASGKESFITGSTVQNLGLASHIKNNLSHARIAGELEMPKNRKAKSRKHHVPCEVGFAESVDNLVEPESYMNFMQFSLDYISKEEISYENDVLEPRFGGHQTLEERENSFYARNQTIHCGLVREPEGYPSTGFDLSEKDKEYMASCMVVVSSCIFGSSDFLRKPTSSKIGTYSKKIVCFMMFLDELTLKKLSSEGHVLDDMGNIGLWRIIVVKNLPYADMRKTGKVPKFLSHRLFPSARYSIWIDSKMRLQADPMLILEYLLWRTRSEYAISNHYDRHCVWEEVLQNKRLNKYNHTAIDEQFIFYQSDGLVKFNESEHSSTLPSFVPEGSFIVRAHTPMSNLFSCLWFNEVDRFTSRDQLSFAYTFLKLKRMNPGRPFYLNMFKDCERRAIGKLFRHRVEDLNPPPALRRILLDSSFSE